MKKSSFFDPKEFATAKKDLAQFEKLREAQIRYCRDVIQTSKKIIYAVHRHDMKSAKSNLSSIKKLIAKVGKKSYDTGMVSVAWQEYVEAATYYYWVVHHKLATRKQLGCTTQDYLLGLSDLSGELVRRAITAVSKGDAPQAELIKQFLSELHWQFLQFDLRSNDLRKKADSLKYNMLKLENVLADYHIRKAQ